MSAPWGNVKQRAEVQRLALSGYDFDCSAQWVLEIGDPDKALIWLRHALEKDLFTFGDTERGQPSALNIGFTYRGLEALRLDDAYRKELNDKAPAFTASAPVRAARHLGDSGSSAADQWQSMFSKERAHLWISIHATTEAALQEATTRLNLEIGAGSAFLDCLKLPAKHLAQKDRRTVHFGFRDGIAQPQIVEHASGQSRDELLEMSRKMLQHQPGELLLGYVNDTGFNRWAADERTPAGVASFFLNGSFAVLRQIEQHVDRFEQFVEQVARDHNVSPEYVKAKLCGRWPNGMLVRPEHVDEPQGGDPETEFDFSNDREGSGCPFGAHIRRTNPRADPIAPARLRPLFRRGMPYDYARDIENSKDERGLIGIFFCASIEDQFEHLLSEWVEKSPLGPPSRGNAKDPLIGNHDEAERAVFHVPRRSDSDLKLTGFAPFLTTRGTLYAFFPSRAALSEIARSAPRTARVEPVQTATAARQVAPAPPPQASKATNPQPGPTTIDGDSAPHDRFCDIVMEGGITSGIIYAAAVVELSKHYRFKSIGGSSIGAFAAALTAAAEYQRRKGSVAGFQGMAALPTVLAEEDCDRKTLLLRLFRPQPGTRRLFEILLSALGDKTPWRRIALGFVTATRQYRRAVGIAVIAASVGVLAGPLALLWHSLTAPSGAHFVVHGLGLLSWGAALVIGLVVSVVGALLFAAMIDVRRELIPNGFGLCRGWSPDNAVDPSTVDLAGFLHKAIQEAAGRSIGDPPLTFNDLWNAPGTATDVLGFKGGRDAWRSIDLQIYSSNLTHGRPYRFPLDPGDDTGRLFFKIDELAPYFPEPLLQYLRMKSRSYEPLTASDPPKTGETVQYFEMPSGDLPIAVAARLAMSFPLLISAVPLWAIDYEPRRGHRTLGQCWFSDGGLCTNFPIHLFDGFIPSRPTFGIALMTRSPHWPAQKVWLPDMHNSGRGDSWDRAIADARSPLRRLGGFLFGLWKTTWRWNDMTMMRMPGVRDRVVRVLLEKGEGGININMTGKDIEKLATEYGKSAADAFIDKFINNKHGWREHRWVRLNRLLISLRDATTAFKFAAGLSRHSVPLLEAIDAAEHQSPLRGEPTLSADQTRELRMLLHAVVALQGRFAGAGDHQPYKASPRPVLRVRHPT